MGEQKILLYLNKQWVDIEPLKMGYDNVFSKFSLKIQIRSIKTLECSKREYKPINFQTGLVSDERDEMKQVRFGIESESCRLPVGFKIFRFIF